MDSKKWLFAIVLIVIISVFAAPGRADEQQLIEYKQLMADIRQLAHILESAHPDPYINGGGKIAFHKRLHDLLSSIPEKGLTREEFYVHLLPFVSALADSHTQLHAPNPDDTSLNTQGGIPLYFVPVEKSLYVAGVQSEEQEELLGSLLVSVEGIAYEDLLNRQKKLVGARNDYYFLLKLSRTGTLWRKKLLQILLPEWKDKSKIEVTLKHPSGEVRQHTIEVPAHVHFNKRTAKSRVVLPSRDRSHFVYEFLDKERKTALLVVDNMVTYRENFEWAKAVGSKFYLDILERVYNDLFKTAPPDDLDTAIAALPSATEVFRALTEEMKEAGTERLVIDLRRNGGGNSLMTDILVYFIFGKDQVLSLHTGQSFEATRYSALYFEQYTNENLGSINKDRSITLGVGDYGLSSDLPAEDPVKRVEMIRSGLDEAFSSMPTFYSAYNAGEGSGLYRPAKIAVLCSNETYSSGYTMMTRLHEIGAILIGKPSSQEGKGFGAVLNFKLDNSGHSGWVSYSYYGDVLYDPEEGCVYMPDYELTYQKLKEYDFDLNAILLYALEILAVEQ